MSKPYEIAANYLLQTVPNKPVIGIICGSGLSGLSNSVENATTVMYEDIPGFPQATVPGHKGELVFGTIGGTCFAVVRIMKYSLILILIILNNYYKLLTISY